MIDFIREFKFGRPQQLAALLLLAFISLCLLFPFESANSAVYSHGRPRWFHPGPKQDEFALLVRITQPAVAVGSWLQNNLGKPMEAEDPADSLWVNNTLRLPFMAFAVSLGGAIWWVSRRLYDNAGGYVALALFCFSWWMILWGSSLYAEMIAAWGLYGMIYTAIGVAHTLYAPSRKWRPRIVLLGLAFGFTLCAHFLAFAIGLVLCAAFMIYLAPGRRLASIGILAMACAIAFFMLWALHGFHMYPILELLNNWQGWGFRLGVYPWQWDLFKPQDQDIFLAELAALAFLTFLFWKRTRYFGNVVPLVVVISLFFFRSKSFGAMPWIWSLPFLFTFIGGICADLFESQRFGSAWRVAIAIIIAAYAVTGAYGLLSVIYGSF